MSLQYYISLHFPNLAWFPLICVCNLPGCVLVLAQVTSLCVLRSDTVEGVFSMRGRPGEHLKRRCEALVRVLLDSGTKQETEYIFLLTSLNMRVIIYFLPDSLLTFSSAGRWSFSWKQDWHDSAVQRESGTGVWELQVLGWSWRQLTWSSQRTQTVARVESRWVSTILIVH